MRKEKGEQGNNAIIEREKKKLVTHVAEDTQNGVRRSNRAICKHKRVGLLRPKVIFITTYVLLISEILLPLCIFLLLCCNSYNSIIIISGLVLCSPSSGIEQP